MKIINSTLLFLMCAGGLTAQEYKFDIRANHADGVYKSGEPIVFTAKLLQDGELSGDKRLRYIIYHNGKAIEEKSSPASAPVTFETKLDKPGWCQITLVGMDAAGKTLTIRNKDKTSEMVESRGVVVDPLKVMQGAPEPKDFDAFWDNEKRKLKELPLNLHISPAKDVSNTWFITADVGQNFRPMNAILKYPANAKPKSLPIFIHVHGAGVHNPPNLNWAPPLPKEAPVKYPCLFLNLNAHGLPSDRPAEFYAELRNGELKNYPFLNSTNKDKYYMKGMILRLVRALDVLTARPEWDGKNIIVSGGSQGGAQALIAAGIDSRVTFIYADVPAMCDHGATLAGHHPGWPKLYRKNPDGTFSVALNYRENEKGSSSIVTTAGYFDAANFAKRIRCTARLTAGGWDGVCPPTSVFAAYNNMPSQNKSILFSSQGGHCRGIYHDTDQQKTAVFKGENQIKGR